MQAIQTLLNSLMLNKKTNLEFNGFNLSFELVEQDEEIHFSTSVYDGDNYVPPSVRSAIGEKVPFKDNSFSSFLTIDENQFKVVLHHLEPAKNIQPSTFYYQLDHFCFLAEEWRDYLDRNDKRDLIYVRNP